MKMYFRKLQEGGRHGSLTKRTHQAQIIPMSLHLLHVDRSTKEGLQPLVGFWFLKTVDTIVPQITNTWGEAKAQQVRHTKNLIRKVPGIRVMFMTMGMLSQKIDIEPVDEFGERFISQSAILRTILPRVWPSRLSS